MSCSIANSGLLTFLLYQVVRQRDKAFRDHKVPHAARLSDALIGQPNKVQQDRGLLAPGNYGVVLEGERVLIARGMSRSNDLIWP